MDREGASCRDLGRAGSAGAGTGTPGRAWRARGTWGAALRACHPAITPVAAVLQPARRGRRGAALCVGPGAAGWMARWANGAPPRGPRPREGGGDALGAIPAARGRAMGQTRPHHGETTERAQPVGWSETHSWRGPQAWGRSRARRIAPSCGALASALGPSRAGVARWPGSLLCRPLGGAGHLRSIRTMYQ
jgi:hypothetical protein